MLGRISGLIPLPILKMQRSVTLGLVLSIGLFIQVSGKVWLLSGSARNSQVYLWLLLPALVYFVYRVVSRKLCRFDVQYVPWVIFLIWVGISTLWASNSESSVLSLAKRGVFIFLYLVAIYTLLTKNEILFRNVLFVSVAMVAFGALCSLIYQYGILSKPLGYRAYRIDRMGLNNIANYGWPVAAGIFNGAIAAWALGFSLDKNNLGRQKIVWLLIFGVLAIYVLMTGSRGAWFALLASSSVSVVMHKSRRGLWGIGLCFLVSIGIVIFLWDQILIEVQKRQLSGRGPIWEYYFQVMSGKWLLGHGLGTPFEYVWPNGRLISPHAHSLFLQQVYDSGVVSLTLMLTGLGGVFYKAWNLRDNPWVKLACPPLIFALVSMLTDVERIFTRPGDYWTVFWLPVAILLAVPKASQNLQPSKPSRRPSLDELPDR